MTASRSRAPGLEADQTGRPRLRRRGRRRTAGWRWVVPDPAAWARLRTLPELGELPEGGTGLLRGGRRRTVARAAEPDLEQASLGRGQEWVPGCGPRVPGRAGRPLSRDGFRRGILDDPVDREPGRAAAYETADWGHLEQIGPRSAAAPTRPRPVAPPARRREHSAEVLTDLGIDPTTPTTPHRRGRPSGRPD